MPEFIEYRLLALEVYLYCIKASFFKIIGQSRASHKELWSCSLQEICCMVS